MPFTPEELLAMGRQEWKRAVARVRRTRRNRQQDVAAAKIGRDINTWIKDG